MSIGQFILAEAARLLRRFIMSAAFAKTRIAMSVESTNFKPALKLEHTTKVFNLEKPSPCLSCRNIFVRSL